MSSSPDTSPPPDAALLHAWRDGDREAGAVLVGRHVHSVFRFFRSKLDQGAEDLTQATFLACQQSAGRLREAASFRAFVFGIARNLLLRHFRDLGRDRDREGLGDEVDDGAASLGVQLAGRDETRLLARALRALPLTEQLVIELHYWEEMSTAEVASALEIPQGTVKWRLAEARRFLRAEIERLGRDRPGLVQSTVSHLDAWAAELRQAFGTSEER